MLTSDPQINRDQNDDEGWKRRKAAYKNHRLGSEQQAEARENQSYKDLSETTSSGSF